LNLPGADVHQTLTQLAEYSAAIAKRPTGEVHIGELRTFGKFTYLKDSLISGPRALSTSSEGADIDGFFLDYVVFENTTIVYRGGPLILRNVRFVNCRFDVPNSPEGNKLLVEAVRQPVNIQIVGG
jgi:hypothetical protein